MSEGMMVLQITAIWAGLLGILMLILAIWVVIGRGKTNTLLGDGDSMLHRRVRVFGNFTEYVPMALLMMAIAEISGAAPDLSLHIIGAMILVGRIMHAHGLNAQKTTPTRVIGVLANWIAILGLSGYLLMAALG